MRRVVGHVQLVQQRAVLRLKDLRREVCLALQQDDGAVAVAGAAQGVVQRGDALLVAHVHLLRQQVDQQAEAAARAVLAHLVQQQLLLDDVLRVAVRQQNAHRFVAVVGDGVGQRWRRHAHLVTQELWRLPAAGRLQVVRHRVAEATRQVGLCAMVQQQLHDVRVAKLAGEMQRQAAHAGIQIAALVDQHRHHLHLVRDDRLLQQVPALVVERLKEVILTRAPAQQRLDRLQLAAAQRRLAQQLEDALAVHLGEVGGRPRASHAEQRRRQVVEERARLTQPTHLALHGRPQHCMLRDDGQMTASRRREDETAGHWQDDGVKTARQR